ncbi:MAG TPA: hypothetical protein VM345_07200 [Acidimicrobiales bacterium]|nr:hypothetical protein [Acidimicrobiales bacterium]
MSVHDLDVSSVDPGVLVLLWELEAESQSLLAEARDPVADVAASAAAFERRSEIDGHVLAARVLLGAGASNDSVLAILRRVA